MWRREFLGIQISFEQTTRTTYERFIVLDYGTEDKNIFHCGTPSKGVGLKLMTAILEIADSDFIASFVAVAEISGKSCL